MKFSDLWITGIHSLFSVLSSHCFSYSALLFIPQLGDLRMFYTPMENTDGQHLFQSEEMLRGMSVTICFRPCSLVLFIQ